MKLSALVLACLSYFILPSLAYVGFEPDEVPYERRVWIKYKEGQRDACLRSLSSFTARSMPPVKFHHDFSRIGAFVVTATVEEINELSVDPMIESIEEDPKRYPMHIPESIQHRELQDEGEVIPYGVEMVQAAEAHARGYTGLGARVCVIDSGIDYDHEDFVTSRLSGFEGNPDLDWTKDFIGHGTHCSGTIAAAKNGIGVVGVAPDADIYSISVFNRRGGFAYGSSILSAVQQCVDAGSNIVSMSLGGPLPNIFEWFAYQNLLDDGVICIAAAGNSGNRLSSYPASYPGVVSVAAVDENMEAADFSQRNRNVDIAAPGVDVLSTFPTTGCQICDSIGATVYGIVSGTSMATPHVSGVAALLRGAFPEVPAEEIIAAMTDSAMDLGDVGRDITYGSGLVQAVAALELLGGGTAAGSPDPSPPAPTPGPPTTERPTDDACPPGFLNVEVSLETDSKGEESYFWITKDPGYPVALGTMLESNKLYEYEYCLNPDCYTFSLFDTGKDGICCSNGQGAYSVKVDGTTIGDAVSFEASVSHSFGTCPSAESTEDATPDCVEIAAIVRTDRYPAENSIKLVDGNGFTIWSETFDEEETLYDDMTACLDPAECYTFTVEDSYGDGICCGHGNGYVMLTFGGETIISRDEAEFGSSYSVSIGNCM